MIERDDAMINLGHGRTEHIDTLTEIIGDVRNPPGNRHGCWRPSPGTGVTIYEESDDTPVAFVATSKKTSGLKRFISTFDPDAVFWILWHFQQSKLEIQSLERSLELARAEVKSLRGVVMERDAIIAQREREITDLTAKVENCDWEVRRLEAMCGDLRDEVVDKDRTIARLHGQVERLHSAGQESGGRWVVTEQVEDLLSVAQAEGCSIVVLYQDANGRTHGLLRKR